MMITRGQEIIYLNNNPNSPYSCRPIKISYVKETSELIKKEMQSLSEIFLQSSPININYEDIECKAFLNAHGTMLDGKVSLLF